MGEGPVSLPEARFKRYKNAVRLKADTLRELVEHLADTAVTYRSAARGATVTLLQAMIEYSGGFREARIWVAPDGVYGASNVRRGELPESDFYTALVEIMETTVDLMKFDHEVLGYKGIEVYYAPHGDEKRLVAKLLGVQETEEHEEEVAAEPGVAEEEPEETVESKEEPAFLLSEVQGKEGLLEKCLRTLSVYCAHGCDVEDPLRALSEDTPVILYGDGPSYVCVVPEMSSECEYRVIYLGFKQSWEKCLGKRDVEKLVDNLVRKEGFEALRI